MCVLRKFKTAKNIFTTGGIKEVIKVIRWKLDLSNNPDEAEIIFFSWKVIKNQD